MRYDRSCFVGSAVVGAGHRLVIVLTSGVKDAVFARPVRFGGADPALRRQRISSSPSAAVHAASLAACLTSTTDWIERAITSPMSAPSLPGCARRSRSSHSVLFLPGCG